MAADPAEQEIKIRMPETTQPNFQQLGMALSNDAQAMQGILSVFTVI